MQPILEEKIIHYQSAIESWFRQAWRQAEAPFYASVDCRNAQFKISPIDTNLFPAGFNNLGPNARPILIEAVSNYLDQYYPHVQRLLLVVESHTRNTHYYENVAVIHSILQAAGYPSAVGSFLPQTVLDEIALPADCDFKLETLERQDNYLRTASASADLIILNHDLSDGVPTLLENVEQPILPGIHLGWSQRRKSQHFAKLQVVVDEFAQAFDLDPWLILPYFSQCGEVDFLSRQGEACLISQVELILEKTQKKYLEYGIDLPPFAVIKADAGTYGMGVMMVKSAAEIKQLNRKQRTRMSSLKGGGKITQVIIQEGVYTFETQNQAVAEPVLYLLGPRVVGGFYRVHTQKGNDENLNSPGMHFEPLPFTKACNDPNKRLALGDCCNQFYVYGVVARLALLAASLENKEM